MTPSSVTWVMAMIFLMVVSPVSSLMSQWAVAALYNYDEQARANSTSVREKKIGRASGFRKRVLENNLTGRNISQSLPVRLL